MVSMKFRASRFVKVFIWLLVALVAIVVLALGAALLAYPPEYVYRVFAWGESDAFDWQKFPAHPLEAAPSPFEFDQAPDDRVVTLFSQLAGVENWDAFLADSQTQAFIVLQDGRVLYEAYFNETQRDSIVTSFSVAKSFTSALVGIAIDEGYINSVNDPITHYLPELTVRDPRFDDISVRDLLLMSSGLEYEEFRFPGLNSDDPLTTYYPDQRQLALQNTRIIDPPGAYFSYNKYHPQLLGMILERSTSRSVTEYLQTKIWDPLGMEFSGSWSVDSQASDFEKMETGVNARAIDFAKFGQLYLNGGAWNGQQVISKAWVTESTQPYLPARAQVYYPEYFAGLPVQAYYAYMWWGRALEPGIYDFAAEGDKGQYIYVSPRKGLVIIRNGIDFGIPSSAWIDLFFRFASQF
jgi:CubicO group peptidase (beta-lactamase class C family)